MKHLLLLGSLLTELVWSQETPKPNASQVAQVSVEEVKVNVKKALLEWRGKVTYENKKTSKFKFIIAPDRVTMNDGKTTRYFDPRELPRLEFTLLWLVQYSAESALWWFEGKGSKTPIPWFQEDHPIKPRDLAEGFLTEGLL